MSKLCVYDTLQLTLQVPCQYRLSIQIGCTCAQQLGTCKYLKPSAVQLETHSPHLLVACG
jgi:hypothetical protein